MEGTGRITINSTDVIPHRHITDEDGVTRPCCTICGRETTFSGQTIEMECLDFSDGVPVVTFLHESCAAETQEKLVELREQLRRGEGHQGPEGHQ